MMKRILYVMRSRTNPDPAPLTMWLVDDWPIRVYRTYDEMVKLFDSRWWRRYDEAEAGDLADLLAHGPFWAMRYYTE